MLNPVLVHNNNLIPFNGEAYYYPTFLDEAESNELFHVVNSKVKWEHDKVTLFGKTHILDRKKAWFADNNLTYYYAGHENKALNWIKELTDLKSRLNSQLGTSFNSCLLNYYENGEQGMGWHSDNEKELLQNGSIASISLGVKRKFSFRNKVSKTVIDQYLDNGSLLLMQGEIQSYWDHTLRKSKKIKEPRINLTFRTIVSSAF